MSPSRTHSPTPSKTVAHFITGTVVVLALATLSTLFAGGCRKQPAETRLVRRRAVHTFRMDDGAIAYRGMDSFWYWYFPFSATSLTDIRRPSTFRSNHLAESPLEDERGTWSRQMYGPSTYPRNGVRLLKEEVEEITELEAETETNLPAAPPFEEIEEPVGEAEGSATVEQTPTESHVSEPPSTEASPASTASTSTNSSGSTSNS